MSATVTEIAAVKESCPAFSVSWELQFPKIEKKKQSGCPYSSLKQSTETVTAACPAFQKGCPFKVNNASLFSQKELGQGVKTLDEVNKIFRDLPASHSTGSPKEAVREAMHSVHKISISSKEEVLSFSVRFFCFFFSSASVFKISHFLSFFRSSDRAQSLQKNASSRSCVPI